MPARRIFGFCLGGDAGIAAFWWWLCALAVYWTAEAVATAAEWRGKARAACFEWGAEAMQGHFFWWSIKPAGMHSLTVPIAPYLFK